MAWERAVWIGVMSLMIAGCDPTSDEGTDTVGVETGAPSTGDGDQVMYEAVPFDYPVEHITFEGYDVAYYFPDELEGLSFVFHGSGGDTGLVETVECTAILNAFIEAGIGYVATESTNRDAAQWNNSSSNPDVNPDLARMQRLRDFLIASTPVEDTTPLFSFGFSNGGTFAALFGQAASDWGWPMRAASVHNSGIGSTDLEIPVIFVVSENDEIVNNDVVYDTYEAQIASGYVAEWRESLEIPLYRTRFLRIEYYDPRDTQETFQATVDGGLVDADGVRLFELRQIDPILNAWVDDFPDVFYPSMAKAQLRVVWATHRINGEFAQQESDFFARFLD
jgi:dienelactone hydrolase